MTPAGRRSWSSCSRTLDGAGRRRRRRRTRCCSPSRWRSGPGAFAPCSSAACRRASSRSPAGPSRSSPTSAGASWPRPRACGCAPSEDALARERYLFYACVSRATERRLLSYRSSDEEGNLALPSPFIADVAELLVRGLARAPPPAAAGRRRLAGRPPRRPPRERLARAPPAADAAAGAVAPPDRASAESRAGPRAPPPRSCRPGRSRRSPTARSGGWSSASCSPERSTPEPEPLARGNSCTACSSELLRELDGPGDPRVAAATRGGSSTTLLAERPARRLAPGPAPSRAAARCERSRPTCAATCATRRARRLRGARRRSSCGSASRSEEDSLPALSSARRRAGAVRGVIDRVDADGAGHGDRPRLQERQQPARAVGRAVGDRPPAAGGAVHARRPRAARARAGRRLLPAAARRRPARRGACSCEGTPLGRWACRQRRPRARGARRVLADAAERAVALAAQLRGGELDAVPADLLARRLPATRGSAAIQ